MPSFNIEMLINGIMFFAGVSFVLQLKQAAQQFVAARFVWKDWPARTSTQRLKSLFPLIAGLLTGVFVLPRIPTSYVNSAFLAFNIGVAFAVSVLILQKMRAAFL